MSLHSLASHLQSAGRGEDKVLVHMTPGEVNGLQSLAKAQGGSLTINPETGLPEAGILKSLLPMLAGFALGPAGFAMMSAPMAGLAVGAATGVATGSLKKGIMAGLGAYGGAGLGQGLAAQGAAAGTPSTLTPAIPNAGVVGAPTTSTLGGNMFTTPTNVTQPLTGGMTSGVSSAAPTTSGLAAYTPKPIPDTYFDPSRAYNPAQSGYTGIRGAAGQRVYGTQGLLGKKASSVVDIVDDQIVPHSSVLGTPTNVPANIPTAAPSVAPFKMPEGATGWSGNSSMGYKYYGPGGDEIGGAFPVRGNLPPIEARTNYVPIERRTATLLEKPTIRSEILPGDAPLAEPQSITGPFRGRMSQVGAGAEKSFSSMEGLKGLYEAMPTGSVVAGGLSLADSLKPEPIEVKKEKSLIRPYEFSYGATDVSSEPYTGSAERTYFQPQYTALTPYEAPGKEYAASGGLMGYAAGGPIEDMAAQNAVGQNTGYPMANLQTSMYSNPAVQRPEATNIIAPSADAGVGTYTGEQRFGGGGATKEPQSSGYTYGYDPKSMMFTQTGGPGVSGGLGGFGRGIITGPESFALTSKQYDAAMAAKNAQQATPNGQVSGGIATPMAAPTQPRNPTQPLIPSIDIPAYQTPEQQLGLGGFYDMMNQQMGGYGGYAAGGNVGGGISHLGDYSDGGRLLKGPGDGVSDSIPASIGNRQPARLADGEFVVPARIVSEIGNGSTEAGARKLYAMMDRVQRARRKTTGKNQVARNTKAERLLPA